MIAWYRLVRLSWGNNPLDTQGAITPTVMLSLRALLRAARLATVSDVQEMQPKRGPSCAGWDGDGLLGGPYIAWGCGGLFAVGFDDGVHATQWRCCCGQDLGNGRLYPEVLLVKLGGHVLLVWAINWVAFIPNSGNPRTPCNEYRMSSTQFPHQQWWMKDSVDSWPQQKNCFF